jgi:hypothetical protein
VEHGGDADARATTFWASSEKSNNFNKQYSGEPGGHIKVFDFIGFLGQNQIFPYRSVVPLWTSSSPISLAYTRPIES